MVHTGTQHGSTLMMPNAGIATVAAGEVTRGNHYFQVLIRVPHAHQASKEERNVLEALKAKMEERVTQN